MSKSHFEFGARRIWVWPDRQAVQRMADPRICLTDFADTTHYHPRLRERILALSEGSAFRDYLFKGGCGTKVRNPAQWRCPEAELVQARAVALFKNVCEVEQAVVDDSWANVYRHGEYCISHSHARSQMSVLYLLDAGDPPPPEDPMAGRLCFGDPRMPYCCPEEEGRMTRLLMPDLYPGSMLLFPSEYLHLVNPYLGEAPRITLSWNIGPTALPGRPGVMAMRSH